MKKLLYITNQVCGAAGLERVLSIKTSYLIDVFNYEIHIITLNQKETDLFYQFHENIIYHDLELKGNPFQYIYQYITKLKTVVNKINPDIISVCDDGLKAFTLPFVLKNSCPIIYERHVSKVINLNAEKTSLLSIYKQKLTENFMLLGAKKFDKFIVLTKDNLSEWNLDNIQVINNPLSFYPKEISNLNNKTVLAVGRQCYQKGYDRLLESWKIVTKRHPDWQLEIYGAFDKENKYHKLAKELRVDSSVSFFKPVKNIGEVYQNASIYVMPSRFEGFGMVLIEAMAYGVPCVSFNCPCGPKEIITNNKDGFLVNNGDTKSFAAQIEKLIQDEDLRHEMGINARQKAGLYFPDKIVPQWDLLFQDLIKKAS
ncbi:glycosyltransferase family 4 protein [Tamlana sp. 2_MG-2023]|uniref:glycosyltransferase family 4 protein n=1 Tax=unclassified Tamlana TaxID=2614803 RepID=UPI0026E160D7|nr:MULTISPECIES: glycosyltransferase family 4 protein [unclassified Tamlana]MDO6759417.1 glycosyltransferase family 4 protein [Tamlana sp. 2_MG-2023]MDO6790444.1 glycosyltransferase family 4 protein [Tamlana sp. 1_MG-2023]